MNPKAEQKQLLQLIIDLERISQSLKSFAECYDNESLRQGRDELLATINTLNTVGLYRKVTTVEVTFTAQVRVSHHSRAIHGQIIDAAIEEAANLVHDGQSDCNTKIISEEDETEMHQIDVELS